MAWMCTTAERSLFMRPQDGRSGPTTNALLCPKLNRLLYHRSFIIVTMKAAKPLSIRCPTCGAKVGEKCELGSGQPRTNPHFERRVLAKDFTDDPAKLILRGEAFLLR